MKQLTPKKPDKEGYYWWTNFGEHTPCILKVDKKTGNRWYAYNEEYAFQISDEPQLELDIAEDLNTWKFNDKYKYGDELWGYIENPVIDGIKIKPDSF